MPEDRPGSFRTAYDAAYDENDNIHNPFTGHRFPNADKEASAYVAKGQALSASTDLAVAAAGGSLPDVVQSWGGASLARSAEAGLLMDLTAELASLPVSAAARNAMSRNAMIYSTCRRPT
jgi:hypothetical protein